MCNVVDLLHMKRLEEGLDMSTKEILTILQRHPYECLLLIYVKDCNIK